MPWSYREKYNSDPVFREKERKRNRAYKASPQGRAKTNEWQRNKYNNDPVYREKERQRNKEYRQTEQGKKVKRKSYLRNINTEKGYLSDKYNHIKKGGRKKFPVEISKEDFLQLWEEHKIKYGGWVCAYTGLYMTRIRGKGQLMVPSNMSVDRLDSNKGYTKDNIVFCRWDINDRKGAVTIEDIKNILRVYNEKNEN
tara:strand:+ start:1708 stop:2298 length:591 start_codon:yes stop_codon:yes gene_type:complete